MAARYPSDPSGLTAGSIDDETLLAIGRLIRAFAELEDMATLCLCRLTGLSEAQVVVIFGKMSSSTKTEIGGVLAEMIDPVVKAVYDGCFGENFRHLRDCRNDVAHGAFMGFDDHNELAFRTQKSSGLSEETAVRQKVTSYPKTSILEAADVAERMVSEFPTLLQIASLRERRLQEHLRPHPKGRRPKASHE